MSASRIMTRSGKLIDLLNPKSEDIVLEDIAWALAHTNRFNGHASVAYSVAEHSVRVSHVCDRRDAWAGLMHDATEAYLGDVTRPLKQLLPAYQILEQNWWEAIADVFGLPRELPASVKRADDLMLRSEMRAILPRGYGAELDAYPCCTIVPFTDPLGAYQAFLVRADQVRPKAAAA
jgi:uncharacterized protein